MAIYSEGAAPKPVAARAAPASRSAKGRAILFAIVALIAGTGSAALVVRYVGHHAASGISLSKIVVAKADVPVGTKLTPEMLELVDWPTTSRPQGAFDLVGDVADRVSSVALVAGEPVVEARLGAKGSGPGISSLIPSNMRAMTVPVNEVIGVGGFIHTGDIVDVITTMQEQGANGQVYRSKIVLQGIKVLAVGTQLTSPDRAKAETVPAVTLLVSPAEAERLALASTQGKLQLTMRSQVDKEEVATPGVSPADLLGAAPTAAPAKPAPAPPPAAPAPFAFRRAPATPPREAAAAKPAAPATPAVEVVEVMRGDKIEQRKVNPKAAP